jgi:hypothetical protein
MFEMVVLSFWYDTIMNFFTTFCTRVLCPPIQFLLQIVPPLALYSRSITHTNLNSPSSFLVDEFTVEGDADRRQEKTGVLVCRRGCVDDDVATGDHLRRVPSIVSI